MDEIHSDCKKKVNKRLPTLKQFDKQLSFTELVVFL